MTANAAEAVENQCTSCSKTFKTSRGLAIHQARCSSKEPHQKPTAEVEPIKKEEVQTERSKFCEQLSFYIQQRKVAEEAQKSQKSVKPFLVDYTKTHGKHTKPGTDDSILQVPEIGAKAQWQYRSRVSWDEERALDICSQKKIEGLIKMVPQVDKIVYAAIKAKGGFAEEELKAMEPISENYAFTVLEKDGE